MKVIERKENATCTLYAMKGDEQFSRNSI